MGHQPDLRVPWLASTRGSPLHVANHSFDLMSAPEMQRIYASALRVLDEMGMVVQNESLLRALGEAGLRVDLYAERVLFPPQVVERCLAQAEHVDWGGQTPSVSGSAGVYHGMYQDPCTGELVEWNEQRFASYAALARRLPYVGQARMLGCRMAVPPRLEPLYERLYCWKHGAQEAGSIHLDRLCPFILAPYEALADERGVPLPQVFRGNVYCIPALKLGRHEAHQLAWFRERGLRVHVGDMLACGATAPSTAAGAVTLNLAEQLALHILGWALFGEQSLTLHCSVTAIDYRTLLYPYGRPEMAITNLMTAQIARWLGARFSGHAGLADAPLPSPEACAQKALTAVPTLLVGGNLHLDAGLLAVDQVCSPIQMVMDDELLSALSQFVREFEVSEETIGLETIMAVGPGGCYLDCDHTLRHFRKEHWEPRLWWRWPLGRWLEGPRTVDSDRARETALSLGEPSQERHMSPELERQVLAIIASADKALA